MHIINGYLIITIRLKVLLEKNNATLILKMNKYFETLKYQKFDKYIETNGVCEKKKSK